MSLAYSSASCSHQSAGNWGKKEHFGGLDSKRRNGASSGPKFEPGLGFSLKVAAITTVVITILIILVVVPWRRWRLLSQGGSEDTKSHEGRSLPARTDGFSPGAAPAFARDAFKLYRTPADLTKPCSESSRCPNHGSKMGLQWPRSDEIPRSLPQMRSPPCRDTLGF